MPRCAVEIVNAYRSALGPPSTSSDRNWQRLLSRVSAASALPGAKSTDRLARQPHDGHGVAAFARQPGAIATDMIEVV